MDASQSTVIVWSRLQPARTPPSSATRRSDTPCRDHPTSHGASSLAGSRMSEWRGPKGGPFLAERLLARNAGRSSPDPRTSARNVGQAYLGFALKSPDAYRMMFEITEAEATGNAELAEALAQARRSMVAYVAPLIHEGIPRGDTQSLGQMLWAAAHGLVMLRLAGIVSSDTELRQLHETTMAALVRGSHQMKAGNHGTGAREPQPNLIRKGARKTR